MNEIIDKIFIANKEIRDRYEKIEHLMNEIEDQKVLKILVDIITIENEERSRAYSQLQKRIEK